MESPDDTQDDYNLDMNDVPHEKLKMIVELDMNNCSYWRRKIKNKQWKLETRNSSERVMEI